VILPVQIVASARDLSVIWSGGCFLWASACRAWGSVTRGRSVADLSCQFSFVPASFICVRVDLGHRVRP